MRERKKKPAVPRERRKKNTPPLSPLFFLPKRRKKKNPTLGGKKKESIFPLPFWTEPLGGKEKGCLCGEGRESLFRRGGEGRGKKESFVLTKCFQERGGQDRELQALNKVEEGELLRGE